MKKILIFGSNGLVGKSLQRKFKNKYKQENLFFSNRNDTNLFGDEETHCHVPFQLMCVEMSTWVVPKHV